MEAVWQAIVHTPLWAWPAMAFSIWIGARELRPRTVPAGTLYILPVVVVALALLYALASAAPTLHALGIWLAAAAPAATAGWLVSPPPRAVDRDKRTVDVPRRVLPLLLMIAICGLRYAFGYVYGRWPELRPDPGLALLQTGLGAVIAGLALGYYGRLLRRVRAG